MTTATRRLSRLTDFSDSARALRLDNPVTFKSLNSFHRNWHGSISNIWNTLPAYLLLEVMLQDGAPYLSLSSFVVTDDIYFF